MHPSVREVAVLQEATQMILASVDLETVLHQILLIVRNYFEVFNASIYSLETGTNELHCRAQNGYQTPAAQMRIGLGEGVIGYVAQTGISKYVPDVTAEPRYLQGHPAVKSELALPLIVRESAIGVLDIESDKPNHFTEEMISLLGLFASQAAVAMENARLYSSERKRMRQIELINLIARSATSASDIKTFLTAAAELISDTFEECTVEVSLKDAANLEVIATAGPGGTEAFPSEAAEIRIPLVAFGDDLGLVAISRRESGDFSDDDRAVAQAAADVCATAVRNIQLGTELHRITHSDSLTGLFNQRHFHNAAALEVVRCRRYHKPFSLVMFDIHDFHEINVAMGFNIGDDVLRQVATTLRSHVRNNDVLCRYAGDRFAIVLPETDQDHVDSIMAKIQEVLCRIEFVHEGQKRRLAAACGSASYPQDGSTEVELIRKLQERLVHAKSGGTASA